MNLENRIKKIEKLGRKKNTLTELPVLSAQDLKELESTILECEQCCDELFGFQRGIELSGDQGQPANWYKRLAKLIGKLQIHTCTDKVLQSDDKRLERLKPLLRFPAQGA
jgi:hypothetical protein